MTVATCSRLEPGEMFYAAGYERGYSRVGGDERTLAIRTNRICRNPYSRWCHVHHPWIDPRPDAVEPVSEWRCLANSQGRGAVFS